METISIKVENDFVKQMDKLMKKHRYTTKTEFVRDAIRNKMVDLEKTELLGRLARIYGASKRKTTDEDLHRAREKAFEELEKELGVK